MTCKCCAISDGYHDDDDDDVDDAADDDDDGDIKVPLYAKKQLQRHCTSVHKTYEANKTGLNERLREKVSCKFSSKDGQRFSHVKFTRKAVPVTCMGPQLRTLGAEGRSMSCRY